VAGYERSEYDLDTDELVYRDRMGNEVLRERFQLFPWPRQRQRRDKKLELW